MSVDAARGRLLVEESREIVAVLDEERRVLSASRRARDSIPGLVEGEPLPPTAVDGGRGKPGAGGGRPPPAARRRRRARQAGRGRLRARRAYRDAALPRPPRRPRRLRGA